MIFVAVKSPIARVIGHEFDSAGCAGRDIHRRLWPPRGLWKLSAISLYHPPAMSVKVDRMTIHAQVRKLTRTRSPSFAISGSVPGQTRLLNVNIDRS
jgi:hypothetical protein